MDILRKHMKDCKLPFKLRATLNDGNCWYCSVADQIILQVLSDLPRDHASLRKLVVHKMSSLHQFKEWKSRVEETGEAMEDFLKRHGTPGEWTDNQGIMCQVRRQDVIFTESARWPVESSSLNFRVNVCISVLNRYICQGQQKFWSKVLAPVLAKNATFFQKNSFFLIIKNAVNRAKSTPMRTYFSSANF